MTAIELRDIILSPEYKAEVREISRYLASIKQERPLVYALAKLLYRAKRPYCLEDKGTDLVVDGRRFEFKKSYDFDLRWKLDKELQKAEGIPLREVCRDKPKHGWVHLPRLYADMAVKHADVFVWMIVSRDLSGVVDDDGICLADEQRRWNAPHPYSDRSYLDIAERFLNRVLEEREFSVVKAEIQTTGDFPSTYHFWLCDFKQPGGEEVTRGR
jgi:hypothetical protein